MRRVALAVLALAVVFGRSSSAAPATDEAFAALHRIAQEVEIARTIDVLSRRAFRGSVVFKDVATVDVIQGRIQLHQSVVVADGTISWAGDAAHAPKVAGALVVNGKGLFLSPGLTDMHVHTHSLGEQLLRLATGTTAVREMSGFPWMLRLRRGLRMPTMYVAGTIIADQSLGGFAVVAKTQEEARNLVHDQAACGFDFIKVHNSLAQDLFDAVADQASREHRDLVGHVPHGISIYHAVHAGGIRTIEHLKGFIDDRTLVVSDEDYGSALGGARVWLTPTFYGMRGLSSGDAARRELARPEMRYVSLSQRVEWRATANSEPDWRAQLRKSLPEAIAQFISPDAQERLNIAAEAATRRLLPLHPRWLTGTDAALQDFQIPGFALLDELILMEKHGIARADVLRAATFEPAAAMRRDGEFGQIKAGMRADLVLLTRDPLRDLSAFRDNRGVVAGGVWLERANLDFALGDLARIEGEPDASFAPSTSNADAVAAATLALSARNVTLDPMLLRAAAAAAQRLGNVRAAQTLLAADTDATPGPCNHPAAVDPS